MRWLRCDFAVDKQRLIVSINWWKPICNKLIHSAIISTHQLYTFNHIQPLEFEWAIKLVSLLGAKRRTGGLWVVIHWLLRTIYWSIREHNIKILHAFGRASQYTYVRVIDASVDRWMEFIAHNQTLRSIRFNGFWSMIVLKSSEWWTWPIALWLPSHIHSIGLEAKCCDSVDIKLFCM